MTFLSDLTKTNSGVSLEGIKVLVAGGTRGIGAGVALRFSQAGASVWIVGRSEQAGSEVITALQAATEARNGTARHAFVSADLAEPKAVQSVVDKIASETKGQGVDHVVLTQGGPPVKALDCTTSTGLDRGFAVQDLSRFGFAYLLASQNLVKSSITSVIAPGQGDTKPLDPNDLDLHKATESGAVWDGLWGTIARGKRDSSVIDAFSQALAEQHPHLLVSHIFPGTVQSNAVQASGLPFVGILNKLSSFFSQSAGPGGYAEVPFWLTSNLNPLPSGQDPRKKGSATLLDQYARPVPISPNVATEEARTPIFASLKSYFQL